MIRHRQVDDVANTGRREPSGVGFVQPAGGGDAIRQPLPCADVGRVAHASPSTFAALSFMIPGITSSRKPTSLAAAIHLSGWISGKSLPNSILCLSWVFAYWITCLGKYFGLQPLRSMNTLFLCSAIDRLWSTQGQLGCARMIFMSGKS